MGEIPSGMAQKAERICKRSPVSFFVPERIERAGGIRLSYDPEKEKTVYSGTDRCRKDVIGSVSGCESSRGGAGGKDLLSDGEDDHKNGCRAGVSNPERAGTENEGDHADGEGEDLFLR